jgi:hypothetical protein
MNDEDVLKNLISNKKNLKIFHLEVQSSTVVKVLPSLSSSENVESSLKEISYSVDNCDNFSEFLKTHQSLEKLTIGNNVPNNLFSNENEDENIFKNMESFEDKRYATNAVEISHIFKFITFLKVVSIFARQLIFLRLLTLEIDNATFYDLRNLFVPFLKVFKIKKFPYCDDYFPNVMHSINSIEIFIIESVSNPGDILQIVKMLKFFPKLQKFELRHGKSFEAKYNMDDNEKIEAQMPFYKIVVDCAKKEVKISSFIIRNCKEIYEILTATFREFHFKEFCFEDALLRTQNLVAPRHINILENELNRHIPSTGFYYSPPGSSAIENCIFKNCKFLTIPDFPVDYNGGKVLKYIIECMNLNFFRCKNNDFIRDGKMQNITEISVKGNQMSSLFEILRHYRKCKYFPF